jgi:hypothetical protein
VRLSNSFFAYQCRAGKNQVLVALNVADKPETIEVPRSCRELVATPGVSVSSGVLTVPGHEWAIYSSD